MARDLKGEAFLSDGTRRTAQSSFFTAEGVAPTSHQGPRLAAGSEPSESFPAKCRRPGGVTANVPMSRCRAERWPRDSGT